jgi:hypothetical protein
MAEDTTPFAADATSDATLLSGENGEQGQPEAAQEQTPPPQEYLSRADFEKWQAETDAKWQTQLEKVKRETQAKADKARDTAIRKAKEFDGYVATMKAAGVELDPEQIAAIKTKTIEQEFWQPQPETETPAAPPPQADTVGADEIRAWLAAQGIVNETLVSNYAGKGRNTGVGWEAWDEDVTLAKAASIQQRKQAQQQKQQAAAAAQVKANVGRVNPVPAGGAPAQGYDPEKELEEMNKLSMPDDPAERVKFKAKRDRLMKEAGWE